LSLVWVLADGEEEAEEETEETEGSNE